MNSKVRPLELGTDISFHPILLLGVWLSIHAKIEVSPCKLKDLLFSNYVIAMAHDLFVGHRDTYVPSTLQKLHLLYGSGTKKKSTVH